MAGGVRTREARKALVLTPLAPGLLQAEVRHSQPSPRSCFDKKAEKETSRSASARFLPARPQPGWGAGRELEAPRSHLRLHPARLPRTGTGCGRASPARTSQRLNSSHLITRLATDDRSPPHCTHQTVRGRRSGYLDSGPRHAPGGARASREGRLGGLQFPAFPAATRPSECADSPAGPPGKCSFFAIARLRKLAQVSSFQTPSKVWNLILKHI